ncbi:MAG: head GIN domain-containing protein [Bacteroidota bacterium]
MKPAKHNLYILILVFSALLQQGCKKSAMCDCVKSTGTLITEERTTSPFHYVELNNKVNLYVHQANEYRITVTAGKHLIEKVTTETENGILRIDNINKCNWVRDFNNTFDVHIYLPVLDTLEVFESSGNIYFVDTMKADRFSFQSWSSTGDYYIKLDASTSYMALQTGPASLYASGKTGVCYMWNQGQGIYDARNLIADDIYASNRSMNKEYLFAKKKLYAKIEYSGDLYYGGNPSDIKLEDFGGGQFIPF